MDKQTIIQPQNTPESSEVDMQSTFFLSYDLYNGVACWYPPWSKCHWQHSPNMSDSKSHILVIQKRYVIYYVDTTAFTSWEVMSSFSLFLTGYIAHTIILQLVSHGY